MKKLLLICGLCALGLVAYVQAQPRGGQTAGEFKDPVFRI